MKGREFHCLHCFRQLFVFGRVGAILAPIVTGALPLSTASAVCSVIAFGGAAALTSMGNAVDED